MLIYLLLLGWGFGINHKKLVYPSQEIVFLGVTINTVKGKLSIRYDKFCSLHDELVKHNDSKRKSIR